MMADFTAYVGYLIVIEVIVAEEPIITIHSSYAYRVYH
jgi:hypothetical protein